MWHLPFTTPALAPGETHLWRAECVDTPLDMAWCATQVTPAEMARAGRFATESLRRRYLQAHTLLHTLLHLYTPSSSLPYELAYSPSGKPSMAAPQLAPRLEFNMSHAGEVVLIAVARGHEVGVDVEAVRPMDDLAGMIRVSCTQDEAAYLAKLAPDARLMAFYWLWTRKEAWLKLLGVGLGGDLKSVEVHDSPAGVTLLDLPLLEGAGAQFVGALALPVAVSGVRVQNFAAVWQGV